MLGPALHAEKDTPAWRRSALEVSVGVLAVADPGDQNTLGFLVNFKNDSIIALADPKLGVSSKFFNAIRPRIFFEGENSSVNSLKHGAIALEPP